MKSRISTLRFGNRVDNYVKYRPGYPFEIIKYVQDAFDLTTDKVIADLGAGTGILSSLFLAAGYSVVAVEPNFEMAKKAIDSLHHYPEFTLNNHTAEETGLPSKSMDAIIVGQAFHWFDQEKSKIEFRRILTPDGVTILIWNERNCISAFEQAYEKLIIQYATDYVAVDHRNISSKNIDQFFYPSKTHSVVFTNYQDLDFDGLRGRLLSSSYMPTDTEPGYLPMLDDLKLLFDLYQNTNQVRINYSTRLYCSKMNEY